MSILLRIATANKFLERVCVNSVEHQCRIKLFQKVSSNIVNSGLLHKKDIPERTEQNKIDRFNNLVF